MTSDAGARKQDASKCVPSSESRSPRLVRSTTGGRPRSSNVICTSSGSKSPAPSKLERGVGLLPTVANVELALCMLMLYVERASLTVSGLALLVFEEAIGTAADEADAEAEAEAEADADADRDAGGGADESLAGAKSSEPIEMMLTLSSAAGRVLDSAPTSAWRPPSPSESISSALRDRKRVYRRRWNCASIRRIFERSCCTESGGTRLGLGLRLGLGVAGGKEVEAAPEKLATFSCSPASACIGGLGSMKRRFGPTNCVMTQSSSSSSSGDWCVLLAEDAEAALTPTDSFAPATNSTGSTNGSGSGGHRSSNAPRSIDPERTRFRDVSLASTATRRGTSSTCDVLDESPRAGGCATSAQMCIPNDKDKYRW